MVFGGKHGLSSYKSLIIFIYVSIRYLIGFKNLIRSIENIGVSAVYGINYYGRGYLSTEKYVNYIKHDVLGKDLLNSTLNYVPSLKKLYRNLTNFPEYGSIKNMWVIYVFLARKKNLVGEKAVNFLNFKRFFSCINCNLIIEWY